MKKRMILVAIFSTLLAGLLDSAVNPNQNFHGIFRNELVFPRYYNNMDYESDYIYHLRFDVSNYKEYRDLTDPAHPAATPIPTPNPAKYPDLKIGGAFANVVYNDSTIFRQQGSYLIIRNTDTTLPEKSLSPSGFSGTSYDVFIQPHLSGLDPLRTEYEVECKPGQRRETISSLTGLQVWKIKVPEEGFWGNTVTIDCKTEDPLLWTATLDNCVRGNDAYGLFLRVFNKLVDAEGSLTSPEYVFKANTMYRIRYKARSDTDTKSGVPALELSTVFSDGQEYINVIDSYSSSSGYSIAPINTSETEYSFMFMPIQKNLESNDVKVRFKFTLKWDKNKTPDPLSSQKLILSEINWEEGDINYFKE